MSLHPPAPFRAVLEFEPEPAPAPEKEVRWSDFIRVNQNNILYTI